MNELPNIDQLSWAYQDVIGQRRDPQPRTKPRAVTASANVNPLDDYIRVDTTSAAVTMTLETAMGCDGRRHTFKKINAGANNMTIACTGAETIDGAATQATNTQWAVYRVISNGTNWELV